MAFKLDALGKECAISTVTENSDRGDVLGKPLQGNLIPKQINPSWPHWLKRVYIENVNPDSGVYGSEIFWLLFLSVSESVEKGEKN
jgi:hypothetical protein